MAGLIGQTLGNYEILSMLGEGGMATVYRARQRTMQRDVAIKVIKTNLANTEEFKLRFEREARTVAALNQPHISKVFDFGEQGDMVYLVMELQSGGSLSDLIKNGPLPIEQTAKLLDQIASALDYAHRQGIVHRDLKPQNILLDTEGNAILSDFGIAKILNANTAALTQSSAALGTPYYMSPEQWQGRDIDARADIYALGVMLFQMLSGQMPFQGDTPFSIMHKHIYDTPPSIGSYRPELPMSVDAVIKRALAKNRDDRYASAGELAKAFRASLTGGANVDTAGFVQVASATGSTVGVASSTNSGKAPVTAILNASTVVPAKTEVLPTRGLNPLIPVGVISLIVILVLIAAIVPALSNKTGSATATQTNLAVAVVPSSTLTLTNTTVPPSTSSLPPTATTAPSASPIPSTATTQPSATVPPSTTPDASQTALQLAFINQNTAIAVTGAALSTLQANFQATQTQANKPTITNTSSATALPTTALPATLTSTATFTAAATLTIVPGTVAPTMNMTAMSASVVPTATPINATPLPIVGSAAFVDKTAGAHLDSFTLSLTGLALPTEGQQYVAWLTEPEGTPFSLGKLNVKADGTAAFVYVNPKPDNLLTKYSAVLITLQGADLKVLGPIQYSGLIPRLAKVHVRHVLAKFPGTPNTIGLLIGTLAQEAELTDHINFLGDSINKGDLPLAKLHLEHIYNIIAGKEDAKDLNGDHQIAVMPPGDGFGMFNYLTTFVQHADLAAAQPDATDTIKVVDLHIRASAATTTMLLTQIQAIAQDGEAKTRTTDLKPLAAQLLALNNQVLKGSTAATAPATKDANNATPNGLAALYTDTLRMAAFPIVVGDVITSTNAQALVAAGATNTATAAMTKNPTELPNSVTIIMEGTEFMTKTITVKVGTSIIFSNQSDTQHTATADDNSFDTKVIEPGTSSAPIKMNKPGIYPFYCQFHGGIGGVGMSGTITVQ